MISVKLNVVGGKHSGQVIPLDRKKFLIGREQDCQLRPNSELVSRHHCIFTVDDFSVRIRDLGSTNGTSVNGERIRKEVVLQPEDLVVVGNLEFRVQIDEVATENQTTSVAADQSETVVASQPGAETLSEMKPIDAPVGSETGEQPVVPAEQPAAETETPAADAVEQPAAPAEPAPPAEAPPAVQAPAAPGVGDTTVISQSIMMPGQTPYQPMMPQMPNMGYPPMYPQQGYPYPGMPQQQPMPMYPQQGYPAAAPGFPQQQAAPAAPAPTADPAPAATTDQPEVSLPDPSETGAKEAPAPKPEKTADNSEAPKEEPSNQSAAAIIQKHMQRRPGG